MAEDWADPAFRHSAGVTVSLLHERQQLTNENRTTVHAHGTLFTIQALRAIAAGAVVSLHALVMLVHNAGYSFHIPIFGASGVDLFFVISGFVMVYTTRGEFCQPNSTMAFIRRRIIRVVPIYWFYTTVLVLLLGFLPGLFSNLRFDLPHVISSYFFLLSKNNVGYVGTMLQTGWTLCYEMYFYLLFALMLRLPERLFLPVAGIIFAAGIAVGELGIPVPVWLSVATNPILIEFYLGAIIARLYLNGFYLSRFWSVVAIGVGIAVILASENVDQGLWPRVVYWGIPGGALLLGAISLERSGLRTPRLLVALGNSSYSLYLVHPFLMPALGKIWTSLQLGGLLHPAVLYIAGFCICVLAGHLSYLFLEKPATRWLSQRWKE
jgi:peptidoglycan/LPS O-acetylase OafA/YrhL